MAETEQFSLTKWFSGWGQGKTWGKSIIMGCMFCILLFGIFTLYRAYFMKTGSNVHRPTIIALPGSTVTSPDMSSEQKVEKDERAWWQPIPFISVFGEVSSRHDGTGSINFSKYEPSVGAQVGLRWDF